MSHASSHWMVDIVKALLKKGEHNVITVHWDSAQLYYPQSASDTRSVGAEIALRVKLLVGGGADRANIWCVGHSLGAHVCGHAGKRVPFGRITGLDPAGPMFELYDNKAGLQKTDADFVDVIHTNGVEAIAMAMGLLKPLGHVDFYPNGGGLQPGCFIDPFASREGKENDVSTLGDLRPACSHRRAIELYHESITSNCKFFSRMICMDPYDIPGSCRPCGGECQTMGYDAYTQPASGLFYLETDWLAPFCLHETK
ncbi:Lipase member I [Lamellibrachia satsuma]|nr:Lipase member I [Lamellibrachia satsuma]